MRWNVEEEMLFLGFLCQSKDAHVVSSGRAMTLDDRRVWEVLDCGSVLHNDDAVMILQTTLPSLIIIAVELNQTGTTNLKNCLR